jgi:hypothetical protein
MVPDGPSVDFSGLPMNENGSVGPCSIRRILQAE